uniref:DUF5776 domain-containing protein n=1 Tax=Lentilactobacillus hilgardii TaxID=1588 RepID=UPI00403F6BC5
MRKINHHFNHLSKWLFAGAVTIIALLTVFIGGPSNASAAPFNLNNMRWGLMPAGDPGNSDEPVYSMLTSDLNTQDWNPCPDYIPGILSNFGTTAGNSISSQSPYVIGSKSPKNIALSPGSLEQSDAKVGDTITQYTGQQFKVTGISLGADSDMMGVADPTYTDYHTSRNIETTYFNFKVEEVNASGDIVSNNNLYMFKSKNGTQYPTILGLNKLVNDNDLVKVTVTPLNTPKGQLFTGTQTLYFSLTGTPNAISSVNNYGYATYQSSGTINDIQSMKPSSANNPITVTIPTNGELYLSDLNDGNWTEWTTDNPNLRSIQDSSQYGYKITGLNALKPGTIVKFTGTDPVGNGTTNDFYFKFVDNSTSGGSTTGNSGTTSTGSVTPAITPENPTPNTTINNQTDTNSSTSAPGHDSSTSVSNKNSSNISSDKVAIKGEVVYGLRKFGLYKNSRFASSNRLAWYPKQKRTKRPMFVVTGYARSTNGTLRYKVRDVNHGRKAAGKTGYITASRKYVVPVYYATMPKNKMINVISKKGIYAYKYANLTGKAKHYKTFFQPLTVKRLVKHNLTTRYQLSNGLYITANKKLVIAGLSQAAMIGIYK